MSNDGSDHESDEARRTDPNPGGRSAGGGRDSAGGLDTGDDPNPGRGDDGPTRPGEPDDVHADVGREGDGRGVSTDDDVATGTVDGGTVRCDWRVRTVEGASLVAVEVRNRTELACRVRVSNRLDGPVRPPRREGVPERGWDESGYVGTLPASGRLSLGYASPASPTGPPVAVEVVGRPGDERDGSDAGAGGTDESGGSDGTGGGDGSDAARTAAVVRRLGSAAPPRDAVPADRTVDAAVVALGEDGRDDPDRLEGSDEHEGPDEDGEPGGREGPGEREGSDEREDLDGQVAPDGRRRTTDSGHGPMDSHRGAENRRPGAPDGRGEPTVGTADRTGRSDGSDGTDRPDGADTPEPVAEWLAAVERRVERGERLTGASVPGATTALADSGGLDAVEGLGKDVAADARALRTVAERAADLAARADAVDVPVESLRRLS